MPESLFIHSRLQIFVGGGDDADIETFIRLITYRTVSTFLYGTQKHLLGFHCEITYLVQEQRAAFRLMEITFLGTVSTCERSFYVSEER